jgi:putative DNA primase/helicase
VPIIDEAGNLDFSVGYHGATGVFRDRTPGLDVPLRPTQDDCKAAYDTLMAPFSEYQFPEAEPGQALLLTFILTALERPFIRTAPMFGINGVAGVGKGKLVRAVAQLAFDTAPRFMTYGFNADEFDKRVGSMFRIPAPCLVIDNANGKRVSNDALESIISEGEGHVRTLGRSELVHVVNRSLLVVTGRGLEFSGDMTRREFTLNLLAGDASPETRVFRLDPPAYVAEHRDELLACAFTLMRAFRQEGAPKLAKTAVGSFPEWEWRVRDLVMWATQIDVADQFARNRAIASDKQADAALLHALYGEFANKPFRSGDAQRVYDEMALEKRRACRCEVDADNLPTTRNTNYRRDPEIM